MRKLRAYGARHESGQVWTTQIYHENEEISVVDFSSEDTVLNGSRTVIDSESSKNIQHDNILESIPIVIGNLSLWRAGICLPHELAFKRQKTASWLHIYGIELSDPLMADIRNVIGASHTPFTETECILPSMKGQPMKKTIQDFTYMETPKYSLRFTQISDETSGELFDKTMTVVSFNLPSVGLPDHKPVPALGPIPGDTELAI